ARKAASSASSLRRVRGPRHSTTTARVPSGKRYTATSTHALLEFSAKRHAFCSPKRCALLYLLLAPSATWYVLNHPHGPSLSYASRMFGEKTRLPSPKGVALF
ncbi:unnamed protein product, partial [Ectocarpus sp. 13 AM-2016]